MHDIVAGCEHDRGRVAPRWGHRSSVCALGAQPRLPARAVEVRYADVEISNRVRPPHCIVDALPARPKLVCGPIRIDERLGAQAPFLPRERSLSKPRQHEQIQGTPVADEGEVDERLAELVLAVDVLHEIRLIDDVDEMVGLGDSPEHPADPDAKLGLVEHPLIQQFPYVEVRAPVIRRIEPQERREQQALPVVVERVVELGLSGERKAVAALPRKRGGLRKAARFELEITAHLNRAEWRCQRKQRSRRETRSAMPCHVQHRSHRRPHRRFFPRACVTKIVRPRLRSPCAPLVLHRPAFFVNAAVRVGRPYPTLCAAALITTGFFSRHRRREHRPASLTAPV